MKIFPRRYYASHADGWANCPPLSQAVWRRIRQQPALKNIRWYATDLEVLNEDSIRLYVYDMDDLYAGGIGERIHEEVITEFADKEKQMLDELVLAIKTEAAEDELVRREARQRELDVVRIRKELFGI